MKQYALLSIFGFMILHLTAIIHGQGFTGPGSDSTQGQTVMIGRPITINEAKNLPHDSWVMLTGNIVNSLPGGNHYTLRDSSGEVAVDIGPKEWRGLSVGVSDRVEIYGEVKITRGQVSIKVHAITGDGKTNTRQGQAVTINRPIAINEAVNLPHDSWVILNGSITSQLPEGLHNYSFRDSSGEVTVDIGPKEWRGLSVGVSDRVEIYGEVKNERGRISIKVQAIRKI
ncbi:MAG: NirD/YgiW/YdeI family stress tolerance protein [Treponema sp.]|nr:NirD/YgiW/YdeI family stress tolerance protein [Treponema sp.]